MLLDYKGCQTDVAGVRAVRRMMLEKKASQTEVAGLEGMSDGCC